MTTMATAATMATTAMAATAATLDYHHAFPHPTMTLNMLA